MSTLALAGPEDAHGHRLEGHPERPTRIAAAMRGVDDLQLGSDLLALPTRLATGTELLAVHTRDYLASLEAFCRLGGGDLDADTYAAPDSWPSVRRAAGAGLAVIDALAAGRADVGFVAVRPPGHHALPDRAMGFCLINNVAVAAARLAQAGQRVLIVDWDVHHGNGTQEIFWNDPRVLYVSTHQTPFYPWTGRAEEIGGPGAPGLTVNIPLPAGATGDIVRRAFDEVAAPVVDDFDPSWVLVSAGFDAHRDDPMADFALSSGDFAALANPWPPTPRGRAGWCWSSRGATTLRRSARVCGPR